MGQIIDQIVNQRISEINDEYNQRVSELNSEFDGRRSAAYDVAVAMAKQELNNLEPRMSALRQELAEIEPQEVVEAPVEEPQG